MEVLRRLVDGQVARTLEFARQHLDFDVAFVTETVAGEQLYRVVDGDAASFGITVGDDAKSRSVYCQLMLGAQISVRHFRRVG